MKSSTLSGLCVLAICTMPITSKAQSNSSSPGQKRLTRAVLKKLSPGCHAADKSGQRILCVIEDQPCDTSPTQQPTVIDNKGKWLTDEWKAMKSMGLRLGAGVVIHGEDKGGAWVFSRYGITVRQRGDKGYRIEDRGGIRTVGVQTMTEDVNGPASLLLTSGVYLVPASSTLVVITHLEYAPSCATYTEEVWAYPVTLRSGAKHQKRPAGK